MPLLYADKAGFNSVMYIQNGGLECSLDRDLVQGAGRLPAGADLRGASRWRRARRIQFDATDCVGPDWQGSAWLRSTQPLGIAVDIIGRDVLMTYVGEPAAPTSRSIRSDELGRTTRSSPWATRWRSGR